LVLNDGFTVLGIEASERRRIQTEDIFSSDAPSPLTKSPEGVESLLLNEDQSILLAGDQTTNVTQFHQKGSQTWEEEVRYHSLGINSIQSMTCIGALAFVGGKESKVRAINMLRKEVLNRVVNTAVEVIKSLQICVVSDSEVYLAVLGLYTSYTKKKTDLFKIKLTKKIRDSNNGRSLRARSSFPLRSREGDDRDAKLNSLKNLLVEKRIKIKKLTEIVNELEAKLDKRTQSKNKYKALNRELNEKVSGYQVKLRGFKKANKKLQDQLGKIKKRNEFAQKQRKKRSLVKKTLLLNQLYRDLEEPSSEKSGVDLEVSMSEDGKENFSLLKRIESLQGEVGRMAQEKSRLRKRLEKYKGTKEQLKELTSEYDILCQENKNHLGLLKQW
jgi:predicted  nucleic acid-binding Zn-ribbon protein